MAKWERDPRGRKPTDKSTPEMRAYWREQYRKRKAKKKNEKNEIKRSSKT